jgi:hypothetical protein
MTPLTVLSDDRGVRIALVGSAIFRRQVSVAKAKGLRFTIVCSKLLLTTIAAA